MSLGKVTCFITCNLDGRKHVLLLKHPYAGNQKELLGSDKTSFQITGWIPQDALTTAVERKHYHLSCAASDELEWEVFSDHHKFVQMWHPLTEDPKLQEPFGEWFDSIKGHLVHDLK